MKIPADTLDQQETIDNYTFPRRSTLLARGPTLDVRIWRP